MSQVDTQNPTGAHRGKPLETRTFDPELGLETLTYRQEVPHGTLLASPTWVLAEQVEYHNTAKSWLTTVRPIPLPIGGGSSPEKLLSKDCGSQSLAAFSCCVERLSKLVKTDDAEIPRAYGELSRSYSVLNASTGVYKILRASGGYMELESTETDNDRTSYKITRSVIDNAAVIPADTATLFYTTERVDCEHRVLTKREVLTAGSFTFEDEDTQDTCLKILNTVSDVSVSTVTQVAGQQTRLTPKGPGRFQKVVQSLVGWASWERETKRTVNYSFPSRLTSIATTATFTPQQRRTAFYTFPLIKTGYSGPVEARVVETLVSSVPGTLETLFAPQPDNIQYDGVLFSLNLPQLLHNAISLTATTHSNDTFYGNVIETFTKAATSPSTAEYNSLINSEVCISDVVEPYGRFCLYKRTRTYIKVK
jgi:hypothetical protein